MSRIKAMFKSAVANELVPETTYRRVIHQACNRLSIPKWSPHQFRHSSATHVRKEFGGEAAQLIGHARLDITQVYAEKNHRLALEVAAQIG